MESIDTYSVFEGSNLFCQGDLGKVVLRVKKKLDKSPEFKALIFSDQTGASIDFNLSGSEGDVLKRLEVFVQKSDVKEGSGPGRPKLGVVSREISLLPRQWEWLASQPGGASSTLRKLIEDARKNSSGETDLKRAQERAYRFMYVMAGDLDGYEEAIRSLYRRDENAFNTSMSTWPKDVRDHAMSLSKPVF